MTLVVTPSGCDCNDNRGCDRSDEGDSNGNNTCGDGDVK